jgi:serine protease
MGRSVLEANSSRSRGTRMPLIVAARAAALLLVCVAMSSAHAADGAARSPRAAPIAPPTDQLIVKWRASGVAAVKMASIADRVAHLRTVAGVDVRPVRNLFGSTDVVRLNYLPSSAEMPDILARLAADPYVEYAEPDGYRYIADTLTSAPTDPFFTAGSDSNGSWEGQWYLLPSSTATPAAIGATTAWQTTTGSPNVVVAIIDTGIIEKHPDFIYPSGSGLPPKLQCNTGTAADGSSYCGYDFVSCDQGNNAAGSGNTADCSASRAAATYYFANDGHGWAADASDPGDWIDSSNVSLALFQNASCTSTAPSSWHGTKVAGVIGAVTNNGIGVAGIAPVSTLLPVRAVGKCTGRVSDVVGAILWAAGIGVQVDAGTIASSPAANIINLSLSGPTACTKTEQDAVNQAIGAGVLIVAAAGNEGGPLGAPANCSGVLSVVGLRHAGTKVPYSNLSSAAATATIAAPGGNCVNVGTNTPCLYAIETTTDSGTTSPSSTPGAYTYEVLTQSYLSGGGNPDNGAVVGTSFAAPMVAGVAALMLAAQPALTPAQLIARLQASATPFPTSSSNTSTVCALATTTTDSSGNYIEPTAPTECVCTKATCGAGMVNAATAIAAAQGMFAQIKTSSTTGLPGQRIKLDGSGSTAASGYTIVNWQWSTIPETSDQLVDPTQPTATLVVPTFRSIQVMLTIADNAGRTASATAEIHSSIGSASGSGALDAALLWLLGACVAYRLCARVRAELALRTAGAIGTDSRPNCRYPTQL